MALLMAMDSRRDMEYKSHLGMARMAGAARLNDVPVVTYSLVILNLVLFMATLLGDPENLAYWFGLIPVKLQFTSLFTSIFLHFDAAHLLINVTFLLIFGPRVERAVGSVEFLLFYIGSGFTASLLHVAIVYAFIPGLLTKPVIGASGAISGVLGMYAIRFRREKLAVGRVEFPAVILLLGWLAVQVVLGIVGFFIPSIGPVDVRHVGYWSHIGGFVFGMTAAWLTANRTGMEDQTAVRKRNEEIRRKALLDVVRRFEMLAGVDPGDPFAYAELGRVWALLGNQPASAANYLKAVEVYKETGRRDEALASLREALRFWPEMTLDHDVVFRFACYFETLGEYEDASKRFSWLAEAARGKPEGEMALLKLGQVELDRLNHPDRAVEALNQLLAEHPNSRWADLARHILSRATQ